MSSTPPPFQSDPSQDPTQPYVPSGGDIDTPKKSGWGGCLIGCLVTFGICSVLCAGVGYYVYSNASTWIAGLARQGIEAGLKETDLPAEEQTAILEQFDRVVDAYEAGELTLEELGPAMEKLAESPIVGLIMLEAVEAKYIKNSGLSDEEKLDAERTMARVARGMIEERFEKDEFEKLSEHFLVETVANPNQPQLKQNLSDEELRAMLADAKELADSKEIPDEDYEFKISEVLRETVDEVLQQ